MDWPLESGGVASLLRRAFSSRCRTALGGPARGRTRLLIGLALDRASGAISALCHKESAVVRAGCMNTQNRAVGRSLARQIARGSDQTDRLGK
jgi:hypothetical protein